MIQISIKTGIGLNELKTYDERVIDTYTDLLFSPAGHHAPGTFGL